MLVFKPFYFYVYRVVKIDKAELENFCLNNGLKNRDLLSDYKNRSSVEIQLLPRAFGYRMHCTKEEYELIREYIKILEKKLCD